VTHKLGDKIRRLRRIRGFTQDDLAQRVGVSKQRIYTIERYDADMKTSTLIRLAEALHTTPNYLLGFDDFKVDTRLEQKLNNVRQQLDQIRNAL